jgi:UDP-N-acetylmuramate--alanine ligase
VATAVLAGLEHDRIRTALRGFTGIQRRFDVHIQSEDIVYIDDYAHHPREIEATLLSVRDLYPDKKITGVFQPHLYSRTRDLAQGFARSLSLLDKLILLDIYPARELPITGVSSAMIFENVTTRDKIMCSKEDLLQVIKQTEVEVLITLGAGDIDKFTGPLTQLLKERYVL